VYRTEKNLEELGADVDAAISAEVKSAVEKAKAVLDSDDAEKMKAARNDLEQSAHKLSEALYKKAQQQQGAAGSDAEASGGGASANGGKGDDDNVVDADFEEVKP
jgi:molecular chaperone DnaK